MKLRPLHYEGLSFPGGVTVEGGTAYARGRGRHWRTELPLGFWRDFSEIDVPSGAVPLPIPSPQDAEPFLSRYGNLRGEQPDEPFDLFSWRSTTALLRFAAQAWSPLDSDGLSRPIPARLKPSRTFLREFHVKVELKDGITPIASDLRDFMFLSAAFMLEAEVPMRRCVECGHWLAATHERTRYCSNACSVRASQRKKGLL